MWVVGVTVCVGERKIELLFEGGGETEIRRVSERERERREFIFTTFFQTVPLTLQLPTVPLQVGKQKCQGIGYSRTQTCTAFYAFALNPHFR